jgi:hypothetical protein
MTKPSVETKIEEHGLSKLIPRSVDLLFDGKGRCYCSRQAIVNHELWLIDQVISTQQAQMREKIKSLEYASQKLAVWDEENQVSKDGPKVVKLDDVLNILGEK